MMNIIAVDRITTESTFAQQMAAIKAIIERNQEKYESCENKLENAEFRFQIEKVQKDKALDRCKEFKKYVKQLEVELRNSYEIEDAQAAMISTLEQEAAEKDRIIAEFQRKQEKADEEKETLESQLAAMKMKYEPLVIKKLVQRGNEWEAYFSTDEIEQPSKLLCSTEIDEHKLFINNQLITKRLVLDGILKVDIYRSCQILFEDHRTFISRLLKHVDSCNLSKLFIHRQNLSWKEYEKLVSAANVKILCFKSVCIEKQNGTFASLEDVLEKLPNNEEFRCSLGRSDSIQLTAETFDKLPAFENLQELTLYDIHITQFNSLSFLSFVMKHPDTHFRLNFRNQFSEERSNQIKATATKFREAHPDKIEIIT